MFVSNLIPHERRSDIASVSLRNPKSTTKTSVSGSPGNGLWLRDARIGKTWETNVKNFHILKLIVIMMLQNATNTLQVLNEGKDDDFIKDMMPTANKRLSLLVLQLSFSIPVVQPSAPQQHCNYPWTEWLHQGAQVNGVHLGTDFLLAFHAIWILYVEVLKYLTLGNTLKHW